MFACNTIRHLTTLPRVNTVSFLAKFFWHFPHCFIWNRPELRFYDLASIVSVPITICKPVRLGFVLLHSLPHLHREIQWQENVVLKCYLWLCNTLTIYGGLLRMISKFHFKYWPNLSELINFYSPWNHQKTRDFLIIQRGDTNELIRLNSFNIRSKIWRRPQYVSINLFRHYQRACWNYRPHPKRFRNQAFHDNATGWSVFP